MNTQLKYSIGQNSHTGLVRINNEDSFAWFTVPAGELLLVADGVGGQAGGSEASQLSISVFHEYFTTHEGPPTRLLVEAIVAADRAVKDQADAVPELKGMGSTIVAALLKDNEIYFTHAGDSRLYLVSNGSLRQLTKDHSYVQDLVDTGQISQEEAEHHQDRNLITQSLGGEIDENKLQVGVIVPRPGDVFLLCTDGLSDLVNQTQLIQILGGGKPPTEMVRQLIEQALRAGGHDNVTVQILAFAPDKAQQQLSPENSPQSHKKSNSPPLFFVILALFCVIAVLIYFYFLNSAPVPSETLPPASEITQPDEQGQSPSEPEDPSPVAAPQPPSAPLVENVPIQDYEELPTEETVPPQSVGDSEETAATPEQSAP